jgi:hypothetical protein
MTTFVKEFEDACTPAFAADTKIGLLSTVSPEGYPHVTLITTLTVKSKTELMWGQFSWGASKDYLKQNPKSGFLVVSLDQHWWTGTCDHESQVFKGDDFDFFNNKPTYRYNAYAGVGLVHYHKLRDVSIGEAFKPLPILFGFNASKGMAKKVAGTGKGIEKMPPFGMAIGQGMTTLKFVSYIDGEGYPRIIPALQAYAADPEHIVVNAKPQEDLLAKIPAGAKVAVFFVNLACQDILAQGTWSGIKPMGLGKKGAVLDIEKTYNGCLPLPKYIYPEEPIQVVYGMPA